MIERFNMRTFRNTVIVLLAVVFLATVGWAIFIHLSYAHEMPPVPQPQLGRTHRIVVNHGYTVYVTEDELHRADFVLNRAFWFGMVSFAALGIVRVYWK